MKLSVSIENWPVAGVFKISRREARETAVVVAELESGGAIGRGECGPNVRYGEDGETCAAQIEALRGQLEAGLDRDSLQTLMPPGAARNALDCALWDLEAKRSGKTAAELAGMDGLKPLTTAFTLSIDSPEAMLSAAELARARPVLKVKLAGDEHDLTRLRAVRAGAPGARLIIDPNESWSFTRLEALAPQLATLGVSVIEQPLPATADDALIGYSCPVPLCADESCATREDLAGLTGKYQMVNIKLDKAGGLTEALALKAAAVAAGFEIMVGCMLGTSLAMAPAMLVAQGAAFVDLDGPLLLAKDRDNAITYDGSLMQPFTPALWG